MPSPKLRLDRLLVGRGWFSDEAAAARAILAGAVTSPRLADLKPGLMVAPDEPLELKGAPRFASRGGEKLERALESFAIDVGGLSCIDIGAGSGGFTDCLLRRGAAAVTAVDVGYGQFDWRLRQDPRVTLLERTNFRRLAPPPREAAFDLAAVDLSFISTAGLLGHILGFVRPDGQLVALVKPQFELGGARAAEAGFSGGVVGDPALHEQVLAGFLAAAGRAGWVARGLVPSPLLGAQGNREFLFWATPQGRPATIDVEQAVRLAWGG